MNRSFSILLAGILCLPLGAGSLCSQPPAAAPGGKPAIVEVHYTNGSIVFMTLADQNIEVQTAFGKLIVPHNQIEAIEFGQHLDKETQEKVHAFIQQLGDSNFQKRELAFKSLVQLGHQAYPALVEVQQSKDQEIAIRAQQAVKLIEQQLPAKLLHRKKDDVIYTKPFTIVGQIQNPTLTAHAEFFGDLNLKPAHLLAIGRPKTSSVPMQLAIDSAKYGSATDQWLATGFQVQQGQTLTITATGTIDLVPPQAGKYMSGPWGWNNAGKSQMNVEGTLQGKIGPNGPVFTIGDSYQQVADHSGEVYLHIVPCIWGNASLGSFQVKIAVEQK